MCVSSRTLTIACVRIGSIAQRHEKCSPLYVAVQLDDHDKAHSIANYLLEREASGHALGDGGRDSALHAAIARLRTGSQDERERFSSLIETLCHKQVVNAQQRHLGVRLSDLDLDFCTFECQVCKLQSARTRIFLRPWPLLTAAHALAKGG